MNNAPIQEIKEKLNIVDIVGEYVQLKKAGVNHKGLCPFHNEKSPSFTVSEPKQFYHCFGCGKGGDVFQFVQDAEGMEFPEALRLLAAKAGIELTAIDPKERNERTRLMDCVEAAAIFFHQQLMTSGSPAANTARLYVQGRKLSTDTLRTFRIGYAPDSWDMLLKHLQGLDFSAAEIEKAGLSVRSQKGGTYDRFRNRIMFPIENAHAAVVGFTGRVLESNAKEAKYVNSPQTPLYDKSAVLYGLSKAKPFIQKMNAVVLTEGQMDVVSCFQEKIRNVVASSGTALTHEQVRLIKRYTSNILLAFDGDSAGIQAAWKGMQIAIAEEMNIKVMAMPEGRDPADIATTNPAELRELAAAAKPFMEYAFASVLAPLDMGHVHDKKKAAAQILPMIALYPDPIERSHYLKELATMLGVEDAVLNEKIEQLRATQNRMQKKVPNTPSVAQDGSPMPQSEQGESITTTPSAAPKTSYISPTTEIHEQQQLQQLLALLLKAPAGMQAIALDLLGPEIPVELEPAEELQILYKNIISQYNQPVTTTGQSSQPNQYSGSIATTIAMIGDEFYADMSPKDQEKELRTLLVSLKRSAIKRRLKSLQSRLIQAERLSATGEQADAQAAAIQVEEYTRQLSTLTAELKNLT